MQEEVKHQCCGHVRSCGKQEVRAGSMCKSRPEEQGQRQQPPSWDGNMSTAQGCPEGHCSVSCLFL